MARRTIGWLAPYVLGESFGFHRGFRPRASVGAAKPGFARGFARAAACALALGACDATTSLSAVDEMVVYGALDTEIFLFDQQLVGMPTGAQDLTAACPLGGTVHIVGSTTSDTQATVDLVYTFADCGGTGSGYDLSFTGDVLFSGSFASTGYKALASTSDLLEVVGVVSADGESVEVDEACDLAVTDRGEAGQQSAVSGEWCGRSVSF